MAEQWVITKLDELAKAHAALDAKFTQFAGFVDREVAELNCEVTMIKDDVYGTRARIAALEPPATPAPDPVCQCGHPKSNHSFGEHPGSPCIGAACHCRSFRVPTEQPDRAPLDPVLVAMQSVYESVDRFSRLADEIRGEWHERTGRPNVITDVAIRAYGRDGAQ